MPSRCNDYGHHAVVPNAAEDRDRDRDDMFEDDDADEIRNGGFGSTTAQGK